MALALACVLVGLFKARGALERGARGDLQARPRAGARMHACARAARDLRHKFDIIFLRVFALLKSRYS